MTSLRIGLIGSGFMGSAHAHAWMKTPAAVSAILSEDPASAARLADATGAQIADSLDALLAACDAVDICTPTDLHHAHALAAARAGRHVVCEKPLARTAHHAAEIVALCALAGVRLCVGHVVRFFPEYAAARALVAQGAIGHVGVMRLSRCSFRPAADRPESWFHDEARSGGMILDLMIHDFDYARWVAGDVERVFARAHFGAAPYALVTLRHTGGAISHIEGGWALPKPHFRTSLEIAGSTGLIEHPAESSTPLEYLLHQRETGAPDIATPTSPLLQDPYEAEIAHFHDVLTGAAELRVTGEDGLMAVRIALAAVESARTGRPVSPMEVA
jgi:predicted dehydrogenase